MSPSGRAGTIARTVSDLEPARRADSPPYLTALRGGRDLPHNLEAEQAVLGAVLIDPAAHGDHREQDLAFLSVFGAPHLEEIIAGYEEAHPLRDGWRERTGLHQLFVLIAHAVLFDPPRGGTYLGAADRAARSALELL